MRDRPAFAPPWTSPALGFSSFGGGQASREFLDGVSCHGSWADRRDRASAASSLWPTEFGVIRTDDSLSASRENGGAL